MTQQSKIEVGWDTGMSSSSTSPALARLVPMEVEVSLDSLFDEICKSVESERELVANNATYPLDLLNRYPQLSGNQQLQATQPWPIAVSVIAGQQEKRVESFAGAASLGSLTLEIREWDGSVRWIYDSAVFDSSEVKFVARQFSALAGAGCSPENRLMPVGRIDLVGPDERRLLVEEWNDTVVPFAEEACIHEMFEAQAERSPDAVALVYE
ncbi:hypothetical protein B7R25_08865, partial [Subtercola boreus]